MRHHEIVLCRGFSLTKFSAVSHDQKTFLAGTIARALAVFCVDEVVLFNDDPASSEAGSTTEANRGNEYTAFSDPGHFLAHLLSFLETPPYLRKALFPIHPNLRTAGTLPSLDMPHHLRKDEWCDYREGVVLSNSSTGSLIDVGLPEKRLLGVGIPPGTRVTLKLDSKSLNADALSPAEPREQSGYYWGYTVRRCAALSSVFTECPFDGGYDLSIGTSERGEPLSKIVETGVPDFQHLLLVFGGVAGLEVAAENDPELASAGISSVNVGDLFDRWINVLPGQGSRTIRTEEAVWLGLMAMRPLIDQKVENG